jgi:enhancing lycopene biosynthesis protein 2
MLKLKDSLLHINKKYLFYQKRNYCSKKIPKVAIILSGCGVDDGSEIHESVSILIHLSKKEAEFQCFAPNISQTDVINHYTKQPSKEVRNVLVESARIARGNILPLNQLDKQIYDAVIFPGGYGVAKNLSSFAKDGEKMIVNKEIEKIIQDFHKHGKPIGMCCISPVIAAKVINNCKITLGKDKNIQEIIKNMGNGSISISKEVDEVLIDEKNHVITTPAYMENAPLYKIYEGIGKMIEEVLKLIK